MRIHSSIKGCSIAALAVLAVACQSVDIGQPCNMLPAGASLVVNECTVEGDLLTNSEDCAKSTYCILTPAAPGTCNDTYKAFGGKCTKSCISNDECFQKETGMECRQVLLDADFINELEKTNPGLLDKYLGMDIRSTSYCALPLSSE
jgi:hypothetical protein